MRAVSTLTLSLSSTQNPVTSSIRYDPPAALNWGMAFIASSNTLLVASGYDGTTDPDSQIYAYDFDPTAGKLTADTAKTISLPSGTFPQGLAVSPDASTLLVGQVSDNHVLVISLASATYGQVTAQIALARSPTSSRSASTRTIPPARPRTRRSGSTRRTPRT